MRKYILAALVAASTALGIVSATPITSTASATTWGMSDVVTASSGFNTYYNDIWFKYLYAPTNAASRPGYVSGGTQMTTLRLNIPWDALADSSTRAPATATCEWSTDDTQTGGADWNAIKAAISNAHADGITDITLAPSADTGPNAVSQAPRDVNDYYCSTYYLMAWLTASGDHVSNWELYDEPDSPSANGSAISAQVAGKFLYNALLARGSAGAGDASDKFVIGSFNSATLDNNTNYMTDYFSTIKPDVNAHASDILGIAGHPYTCVTSGGSSCSDTTNFTNAITAAGFNNTFQKWYTETGDWLDNPHYTASDDGTGAASQAAANRFRSIVVARAYWYSFRDGNGFGWDSGLEGPGADQGRPAYHVLYGNGIGHQPYYNSTLGIQNGTNATYSGTPPTGYYKQVLNHSYSDGSKDYECNFSTTNNGGVYFTPTPVTTTDTDSNDLIYHYASGVTPVVDTTCGDALGR